MEDKQSLASNTGKKEIKRMSNLERKLVRLGMGAAVVGSTLFGNIRPAEGRSIDISGGMPGKPVELFRGLEGQQILSSLPTATLTEGETKALTEAFPDAKGPQFTDVASNVSVDNTGRVIGLPFEKDSSADKLAQSYQAIIATADKMGGAPEVLVGRNMEKGTVAIIIRNTQPFTAKGENTQKTYKKGSFLFIDNKNSFGYLELTDRHGGEKDVLKLFAVDKSFQNNVQRFFIGPKENPQQLKAPAIGEFTVAQVDEKENAQVVVISGFAIPLFDTGDSSVPKATPQPGTSSDLPTPEAPEVRAKVAEPAAILESADIKLSKDNSTITINGKEYNVRMLPPNVVLIVSQYPNPYREVKPTFGVIDTKEKAGGRNFFVTGVVVGTDQITMEVSNPRKDATEKTSSLTLERIYLEVPTSQGPAKVRLSGLAWGYVKGDNPGGGYSVSFDGQEWHNMYWSNVKDLLVPGNQFSAVIVKPKPTSPEKMGEQFENYKKGWEKLGVSFPQDFYDQLQAYQHMSFNLEALKNLKPDPKGSWIDIMGWDGIIVNRPDLSPQSNN